MWNSFTRTSMPQPSSQENPYVVKISFRIVAFATIIILGIGALGGAVSTYLLRPPLPPLTDDRESVTTTVREVTISPSKAIQELVDQSRRSIVIVAPSATAQSTSATIGIIVTNDGYIVSPKDIGGSAFVTLEEDGSTHPISRTGSDTLFGLIYYRYSDGVFPPIDIATEDPSIGEQLLMVGRSFMTGAPYAETSQVYEYSVPDTFGPPAIQRAMHLTTVNNIALPGGALINEDGKLAGIVIDSSRGVALSASDIRISLDRATSNKREFDPFRTAGITMKFSFEYNRDNTKRSFAATIQSVQPGSPAALAGIRTGDILRSVNDTSMSWDTSVVRALSAEYPLTLIVERGGQEQTLMLRKQEEVQNP